VELPRDRKAIGCKWVYKIKRDGKDQVERYRTRFGLKDLLKKKALTSIRYSHKLLE